MEKILLRSRFTSYFLEINNISPDSFQQWLFKPGMSFQDTKFWWGNSKKRKIPHEGIDLHCYTDNVGNLIKLDRANKFPLLFSGRVAKIFDDFQGKTLHVVHDIYASKHNKLHSLYGHIKLLRIINSGDYINKHSAVISAVTNVSNKVPPHLHLTVFWAPRYITELIENWSYINLMKEIQLVDPKIILES